MNEIALDFYFRHPYVTEEAVRFIEPVEVLTTRKVHEVRGIVERIEQYNEQGYYAAGYISYEAAPAFNSEMEVHPSPKMPLIWFGIFEQPVSLPKRSEKTETAPLNWTPDTAEATYRQAIQSIKGQIEAGNTYQVNHTIRLLADFEKGHVDQLFTSLQKAQRAKFCAQLRIPGYDILSASPELFFAKKGNQLQAKPMKGTIKRGRSWKEDQANIHHLRHSAKEQSENIMIVDLLRNDLGKISVPGTVIIPGIFDIEQYPTVHQMTSTIESQMAPSTRYLELFEALFPCGSITGAPKLKTMSIICGLEPSPRDVYCGAIGYFTPEKTAVFNVPIRTLWVDKMSQQATYGVGGGITWESTPEAEYDEILSKGRVLTTQWPEFEVLESLLLNEGNYWLLDYHLNRLKNTALYFGYPLDEKGIITQLEAVAAGCNEGRHKVRLLLDREGRVTIETSPVALNKEILTVAVAQESIDKRDIFFYHKTTNRKSYQALKIEDEVVFDTLLWNRKGELTEFINGNFVCEIDGKRFTPPIESGLLAGTFRQHLLETKAITEKVLTLQDLDQASAIWFINSIRGWVQVELKE